MLSIHLVRLRWIDVAIDGVGGGPRLILFRRDLDAAIARERWKAVEVVDIRHAMHPDECWGVRPAARSLSSYQCRTWRLTVKRRSNGAPNKGAVQPPAVTTACRASIVPLEVSMRTLPC